MRPARTNSSLNNPFKNRFHDPVTWRLDEMQAHSNVVLSQPQKSNETDGPMYTGIFAFVFVLLASAVVLFRGI